MARKRYFIIDGHYQIYRSFYAPFRELTSPTGEPTRATFVFCQALFNILRNQRPDYLAMALDVSDETTFRRELDAAYKAQRDPAPEALLVQEQRIISIVEALGVPIYRVPSFEADDVMATMADELTEQGLEVVLVSRDKDLEQLIRDGVILFDAANDEFIDADTLKKKKGYTPAQAVDIQTLVGDTTDNIPGVPGIGNKTAVKLINEYGSAQGVLDNADRLTPKMKERVKAFADQIEATRELVTLRHDVPLDFSLEDASVPNLRFENLRPIFEELGFNRLLEQLDVLAAGGNGGNAGNPAAVVDPTERGADTRGTYQLVDTPERFGSFLRDLANQPTFAFDTETTGLNPVWADAVGISISWSAGAGYYIPVRAVMGSVLPVDLVVERLKPFFEDPTVGKVGHNVKYDMLVLRQLGIETQGVMFDTRLASFLLEPSARSHSLDTLAKRWFDHTMIPISALIGKGRNQTTIDQMPTAQVGEYAGEDADFTWRLYEVLSKKLAGSHAERLFHDTEIPLITVLAEMEHNGIALDDMLLARLSDELAERMESLKQEVFEAAGRPFNIDSTKQLSEVLFDEQRLGVVRRTKTGRSTDHATLETLAARSENPIPGLILQYRELAKLKNTYVDTLPKMVCPKSGRIHAVFDQTGTVTGRLSSRDPNLQNIPIRTETGRQIRRAFVAGEPGHVLLTADYSQIELRLLAHFSQDEALLEAFRGGQDIHRAVAAEVNGVAPEEVTPAQRSAAKAVNFGIIYGQTPFGLGRALGIATGEARNFIEAYFARYPGVKRFIEQCIQKARDTGYAETILGRRRPVEELRSRNRQQVSLGERIAVNTVVQGSAADLIKRAMIAIHRAGKAGEHAARMLIQVHDELVFELPKERADTDAGAIRHMMEHAIDLDVPLVADVGTGPNWADSK